MIKIDLCGLCLKQFSCHAKTESPTLKCSEYERDFLSLKAAEEALINEDWRLMHAVTALDIEIVDCLPENIFVPYWRGEEIPKTEYARYDDQKQEAKDEFTE